MRRPFARSAALVAALTIVAFPAARATAQVAPRSVLTFTGAASATDIGLGGVVLNMSQRVTIGASGNSGSFSSFNQSKGKVRTADLANIRVGNGPQSIPNLLTVGAYTFSLTSLPSGPFGQDACYTDQFAIGQTCTPFQSVQGQPEINAGLSPFYVVNYASGNPDAPINSIAAFNLVGTVTGPGGVKNDFYGVITSSFVGLPFQVVLYTLEQEGLQNLPFTGIFVAGRPTSRAGIAASLAGLDPAFVGAAVNAFAPDEAQAGELDATVTPEPSTLALAAAGLAVAGGVARRRRARTA